MNVILILCDSLNKEYLSCYGNEWINTPNIQRLADKGKVFDSHYIGSAPCIPARRELFTGRKEFMWRGWGQTEPFDDLLAKKAKETGAYAAMVTDHYHYWNANDGYGYTKDYNYLNYIRGAETDNFGDTPFNDDELPKWAKAVSKYRPEFVAKLFYRNAMNYHCEEDYQAPKVMSEAADWLNKNSDRDKFFLTVESFDPHEPWYLPESFRSMYGEYNEDFTCWPPYQVKSQTEKFVKNHKNGEVEFIKSQYAGSVSLVDKYLGRIFDVLDEKDLWKDTAVILTSDHGHELYEKERYGKSYPHWNTHANIPLIVWHPDYEGAGEKVKSFSTTVDLYSTILDILESKNANAPHGRSLMPIISKQEDEIRETVVYGSFGTGVCMTDSDYTYFSGYDNSKPLFWYSTHMKDGGVGCDIEGTDLKNAESGKYMPDVDMPVWKLKCITGGCSEEMLFSSSDKEQTDDVSKSNKEALMKCREKLIKLLDDEKVPEEQYYRLGLK